MYITVLGLDSKSKGICQPHNTSRTSQQAAYFKVFKPQPTSQPARHIQLDTYMHTHRQTDRQTRCQTHRQTGRQTDRSSAVMHLLSCGCLEGEGNQESLPSASSSNQPTFHPFIMLRGSLLYCSHPSLRMGTNSHFTCMHTQAAC